MFTLGESRENSTSAATDLVKKIEVSDLATAAILQKLWNALSPKDNNKKGTTSDSLEFIDKYAINYLCILAGVEQEQGPLAIELLKPYGCPPVHHYKRRKGWRLEITIQRHSTEDCTIILKP